MKTNFLFVMLFIVLYSCGIQSNVINKLKEDDNNQQEGVYSYDGIVSIYEANNKEKLKEIELGENKWFLDGLRTCNEISKFNLLDKKGQRDFVEFLGLEDFYNVILKNDLTYDKYFDENGEILLEYKNFNIDEKDLLFVMFFSGKIEKNFFINQMNFLSGKYYSIELSNSIILNIISQYIKTGENITYDLCKKEFLNGYNNYKIEK